MYFPTALTIEGPGGRLDLGGQTVSCRDVPQTIGILLVGENAQVKNGTVRSCGSGVVASDKGKHRVFKVTSRGHSSLAFSTTISGSFVNSHGNVFISNRAESSDVGFFFSGNENMAFKNISIRTNKGFVIDQKQNKFMLNTAVKNRIDGFSIQGLAEQNHFIKNRAFQNGMVGFRIEGNHNKFVRNYSVGNGVEMIGAGFRLFDASNNFLGWNVAKNNTLNGFEIEGAFEYAKENVLLDNVANENGQRGIFLPFFAEHNTLTKNTAIHNGLVDLEDGNQNCDLNKWIGNRFDTADPQCIR